MQATVERPHVHDCQPGDPWTPAKSERAIHSHATEVDGSQESGWPSGDTVRMHCPVCKHSWTEELPQ